jgi:hypothetical protein
MRDRFDPATVLWTVMYSAPGGLMPYAPEFTGLEHADATHAMFLLRGKYPGWRFCLSQTKQEHLSVREGRKALANILSRGARPELVKVARKVRRADLALMAPVAFQAEQDQQTLDQWERANEQRKRKGLPPLPKPNLGPRPQVETRGGRVVIRMGGAS